MGQATARFGATISDPALQQQAAGARIAREAGREAAVLAFNDVFFLIGSLACIAFVVVLAPWVMNRLCGHNPLSKELAFLETMRPGNK